MLFLVILQHRSDIHIPTNVGGSPQSYPTGHENMSVPMKTIVEYFCIARHWLDRINYTNHKKYCQIKRPGTYPSPFG